MTLSPIFFDHPPQTAMSPDPGDIPFDHSAAAREGWSVAEAEELADGTPGVQLQRIDCPEDGQPIFRDDVDAWRHVVARARTGSRLHRRALALVDKVERALIEITCGAW